MECKKVVKIVVDVAVKKNAIEKEKAMTEATNYVVVEYADAQDKAKKLGRILPRIHELS